jgi:hypothetical protein
MEFSSLCFPVGRVILLGLNDKLGSLSWVILPHGHLQPDQPSKAGYSLVFDTIRPHTIGARRIIALNVRNRVI